MFNSEKRIDNTRPPAHLIGLKESEKGGDTMGSQIRTAALLAVLTVLFVLIGDAIGGRQGMIFAFAFACIMNFGAYWFSDKLVLAMYKAKPVSEEDAPQLYAMVRELTQRAGLPMPKLYIIPTDTPNAFATGRDPHHAAVAVTQGILRILSPEELMGVLGHELAHVKHRDILIQSVAATVAGAITMLARIGQFAMIFGMGGDDDEGGGLGALILLILAPIAAMLIQMAISRAREFYADRDGANFAGNPLYLASALQKLEAGVSQVPMETGDMATAHMFIVNPFKGKSMMNLFSTHPPTEERIKRLKEMALQ
jgi:heat shock protein HtpX